MKYFLVFIRFWKKFIFGSDSNIAIFTMWAVIFVWSFTSNYMNMWWILPLAVSVMILLFFYSDRVFENSKLDAFDVKLLFVCFHLLYNISL